MKRLFVLDMDEILADFVKAACEVHCRPVESVQTWLFYEQQWGITSDEFWSKIHAYGDTFYAELVKPKPWAYELLERCKSLGNVVIMSSPGIGKPVDYAAKRIWVDKYAPGVKLIVGSEKHLLAAPGRMLIDDNETTCKNFEIDEDGTTTGGFACLAPYPWNRNRHLVGERLPYIGGFIDRFVERN